MIRLQIRRGNTDSIIIFIVCQFGEVRLTRQGHPQIFGEDVENENSINYIKEFLSSCHQFHSCFYEASDESKVFWNCSNFLSLLNLPRQIHQFGPLRLHWEGIHERFIQCVKPMLKNMRSTTSYLNTKLQQIHNNCVIENVFRATIPGSKKNLTRGLGI